MKFYLNAVPFGANLEEILRGVKLAGADPVRYQTMLGRLKSVSQVADEGGFTGICFSEQHANVEGIPEVTCNPLLLDAFVAAHTKQLLVGQLGMTLTAHHPLMLAEDIALLDQITAGRVFSGFTRGNSRRWVDTFGLPFGTAATKSDKSSADEANLRAVEEAWTIIKKAWTEETFSHQGEFWTVPAPNITWDSDVTRVHGQGVGEGNHLLEMGSVPHPFQTPHPPLFAPLAARMTTAAFWVEQGATAVCYTGKDDFLKTAHEVLSQHKQPGPWADRPALAPAAHLFIGRTHAEAEKLKAKHDELFSRAFAAPPFNIPSGRVLCGDSDEISSQIEELSKVFPFEELFLWHNVNWYSENEENESLELFCNDVLPRFAE
jgi:alkanesulfonate monooxygenase SsuD/methylene tetrahydromethanopterin reductase-like flavin-dependent oxidoreductase (luciferase family)